MFGSERSRVFIEKMYLTYDKKMDTVLEMFLSGNVPSEKEELKVII
jgi:hypothetical protein